MRQAGRPSWKTFGPRLGILGHGDGWAKKNSCMGCFNWLTASAALALRLCHIKSRSEGELRSGFRVGESCWLTGNISLYFRPEFTRGKLKVL